jgi:hypothetical protein
MKNIAHKRRAGAEWMATLETCIIRLSPAHAGKINWDAAAFHFNQGRNPGEAAEIMIASESPIERR